MSNDLHLSVGRPLEPYCEKLATTHQQTDARAAALRTSTGYRAHWQRHKQAHPCQNGLLAHDLAALPLSQAIPAPSPLHRQSSLISNHSLQLDRLAGSQTDGPSTQPLVKPLSPISEQSYVPTPTSRRDLFPTDVEPSTPVSSASTYSAFLRRPLKRSISATSTSSNVTSIHPPTLPPLNITPLEIRPIYPPVSHRAGPQLFSTVYEDTASERTGSFVTARSLAGDTEDTVSPTGRAVDVRGPSGSTTLYSSAALPVGGMDPFTDSDRASTPFTMTPPSGSGSGNDSSSSGAQQPPHARPRPRTRGPTSGGSGSGTSDTFALRRLTFGSALSRPSFSAARRAALARLPPLPILLFWAGFVAPWCWLIGGWLIAEGRWEENGKARAALPLWRPRKQRQGSPNKGKSASVDPLLGKDLEKGQGEEAKEGQQAPGGVRVGDAAATAAAVPHRHWAWAFWNPFAPRASALLETHAGHGASPSGDGDAVQKEKVVTFVKPYSAEVWVYRCRLAAVISAVMLLTAFIVTLVIVGGSSQ
ncbi:hypothetical protein BJY52DRAFT_1184393 [Lactarius psammicola]|nr:hypothetical protein BJY52DRAFT_1184393 [Lactarius psammicola]